jgi:endo-1,4-beta-xylanase
MKQNLFFRKGMKVLSSVFTKKVLGFSTVALLLLAACSKEKESLEVNVQDNPIQASRLKAYSSGTNNGYFWSLYREGGSASITFGSGGNFAISYSNVTDVVGGKGWNPGSARTVGYNIGALSGSYNFVGIYGWTTNPLIEYYIAEKGSLSGTKVNTVNSDGHTYTFYKQQRVNAPSIIGTATFWQYKDSWGGASTGSNRSISMANHINNWKSKGGQGFGSYNYMIFALEAWGTKSGYINATVW